MLELEYPRNGAFEAVLKISEGIISFRGRRGPGLGAIVTFSPFVISGSMTASFEYRLNSSLFHGVAGEASAWSSLQG